MIAVVGIDWLTPEGADWLTHLAWFGAFIVALAWRTERPRHPRCARCDASMDRWCRRNERPAWLGWPGHHAGHLPYTYGDTLDPAWLEPAATLPATRAVPPDDQWLHELVTDDQAQSWPPLDVEDLMVARLLTQIEHLDDTRPMEVARG